MTNPQHWPDIADLTLDCLFCAVGACSGSLHLEDKAFSEACAVEIRSRLGNVRERLARSRAEKRLEQLVAA